MTKKLIIIALSVLTLGLAYYFLVYKKAKAPAPTPAPAPKVEFKQQNTADPMYLVSQGFVSKIYENEKYTPQGQRTAEPDYVNRGTLDSLGYVFALKKQADGTYLPFPAKKLTYKEAEVEVKKIQAQEGNHASYSPSYKTAASKESRSILKAQGFDVKPDYTPAELGAGAFADLRY